MSPRCNDLPQAAQDFPPLRRRLGGVSGRGLPPHDWYFLCVVFWRREGEGRGGVGRGTDQGESNWGRSDSSASWVILFPWPADGYRPPRAQLLPITIWPLLITRLRMISYAYTQMDTGGDELQRTLSYKAHKIDPETDAPYLPLEMGFPTRTARRTHSPLHKPCSTWGLRPIFQHTVRRTRASLVDEGESRILGIHYGRYNRVSVIRPSRDSKI